MRFWVALAAVILGAGLLGVEVGMGIGQRSEWGAVAGQRIDSVALPALRCANGDPPRAWTRVEAESAYHAAKMYQESAEAAGLWNDLGQRAFRLSVLRYLDVLVCWSEGEGR